MNTIQRDVEKMSTLSLDQVAGTKNLYHSLVDVKFPIFLLDRHICFTSHGLRTGNLTMCNNTAFLWTVKSSSWKTLIHWNSSF